MSISAIRAYFKSRIQEEIPRAFEHKDAINIENMPVSARDKTFHISYQNSSNITTDGDHIADNISVTVTLLFKGFRDVQSTFDSSSDTCHRIKRRACNIANFTNGIKRVTCDNITITESDDTNDNFLECRLEFSIRMDFTTL
tara:strand:+ start:755 stop:1180 length:426 start_codon:yes stop_codon:yes gene_type:complete